MNGHAEHTVQTGQPRPPLKRERSQATATPQPATEAQVEVVEAPVVPQAPLEAPVAAQDNLWIAPSAAPTRQSARSTRGVAPQRMTYKVRGKPTAYFLAEYFQTMIQGLVSCVNQRVHQQSKCWL